MARGARRAAPYSATWQETVPRNRLGHTDARLATKAHVVRTLRAVSGVAGQVGCRDPEPFRVRLVQSVPTEAQRLRAADRSDGPAFEQPLGNVEAQVPSGRDLGDPVAVHDRVPQGE